MAFFNDLGKKLGEVAGETADKAKDLAETAKLKTEISSLQRKLQSTYAELGQVYYNQEKEAAESPVLDLCKKVSETETTIADLEVKVEEIKNN